MTPSNADQKPPENAPLPGTYKHYKGAMYQVLGMAQHSETEEWLVVYQALYGEHGFWLRPLSIWLEPASQPTSDNGKSAIERFTLVSSSSHILNQLSKLIEETGT